MEIYISLLFKELTLPSQNLKNYLIELLYENKKELIIYPQSNPIIINLSQKSDKQILSLNIKSKQSTKKQKIFAHGELIIFKKILLEKPQDKYIILFTGDKENDRVKPSKDSMGKILVQMKIAEPGSVNKSSRKEIKIEVTDASNKKEIKEIKEIKNGIVFDDNILDIKAELIDKNEMNIYNIDDIISIDTINKLKDMIDNEEIKKELFPKDINSLKKFNENLFKQYKDLNEYYFNILTNISKNNEEIKQKINKYYNDNIQLEDDLYKIRLEVKQNKEQIEQKIKENNEKGNNINKKIQEINNQEKYLLDKIKIKNENEPQDVKSYGDENDLKNLCNLIKKLNMLGYNIDDGDITDSEKQNLNDLLNNEDDNKNVPPNENKDDDNEKNESIKDNYELGNIIVSLIERDVNDLYMRKLIEQIKIDQIDAITYSFTGETEEKKVIFNVENNNLICSTGETFTVWLIKNFSL